MTDPQIALAQGTVNLPQPDGAMEVTNPVVVPRRMADRLAHMDPDLYDTSPESHLSRLLKALLGDAGVGRLEKSALLARLQHSLHGTHFYDLDRFYGALFGAQRASAELIGANPYTDMLTDEEWEAIGVADDSFRTRVEQLARAINFGATPTGMELAAEALLGCDVDIYESFVTADRAVQTYDDLEGLGTYGDLEAFRYGELEGDDTGVPVGSINRAVFVVVPKREITEEERYDVLRVLSVLKPAASIVRIRPLGQPHLTSVALRDVAADSEMWRIIQKTPRGLDPPAAKRRPPFTAYQGEAWSHVPEAAGVASYTLLPDDSVGQFHVVGTVRVTGADGKPIIRTYTPDLAVASLDHIMGGRAVSDGILARHPYAGAMRGNLLVFHNRNFYEDYENFRAVNNAGRTVHNIMTDGYYLYDAGAAIPFGGGHKTFQDFWATPERPMSDTTREVVEMRFRSPHLVNHIALELPRFPHKATVQAWDPDQGGWVTMREWTVRESFPEVVSRRVAWGTKQPDTRHPQHSVAGHWMKVSDTVAAVRTERVRVVLQRGPYGDPPKDWRRQAQAYSLGVKNWDVGYRIRGRDDIPEPDESLGGGFATTIDSQGNTVVLDVAENLAENLLNHSGQTWRSEPQPTNRAVVNLYLDARDEHGEGQLIDTFRLDPSKSGAHLNIYWANQDTYGSFPAADKALDLLVGGVVTNSARGVTFSDADPAWLAIDNAQTQFDPSAHWWMGMRFQPRTAINETSGLRMFFGDGQHLVVLAGYDAGLPKVGVIAADTDLNIVGTAIATFDAAPSDQCYLSVWNDNSGLHIAVAYRDQIQQADTPVSGTIPRPENLYIGGHPSTDGTDMRMDGFFLKVGDAVDPIDSMRSNFNSYLLRKSPTRQGNDFTANTILRYHPSFSTADKIIIRGGLPRLFESLSWHPVGRDYKVTKGFVRVPPVRAKFWKFEFTDLVPEPMESFLPITRHVRVFPPEVAGEGPRLAPPRDQWPGLKPHLRASYNVPYRDTPVPTSKALPSLPPTAAQYVTDLAQSEKMRGLSWLFGYRPWQIGHAVPRFQTVGQHRYDEYDIVDTSKLGFFVGLKEIEAYRTDYEADDDTAVYRERFHDDANIESSNWTQTDGRLSAPEQGSVATSKPFRSRHSIRAVQFASTQTDAIQIVNDDDFRDESLATSTWDDETKWHAYGDGRLTYRSGDSSVEISRDLDAFAQGPGSVGYGSSLMAPPMHPVFSFRDGGASSPLSQAAGGIESGLASTSPAGMLHAAARVTALTDTENPLVLQIVGSDGTVLAESQQFLKRGETKEWSVGYQLGAFDRGGYSLYEPRTLMDVPMHPVAHGDPAVSTGDVPTIAPDELVRVRLIQQGASTDTWKVDRLSIFDDGIVWEFSNDGGETWYEALDIRNNADGVLVFPRPSNALCWRVTSYRPNRDVTSLQIRPWYERQMGTVMGVPQRGPNVSSFDHEPPIDLDPEFKAWSNPVPRWWWRAGRRFPILPSSSIT